MNARRVSYHRVPVATKGHACRTREIAEWPLLKTVRFRYLLLHCQCSAVLLLEVVFPARCTQPARSSSVPCPWLHRNHTAPFAQPNQTTQKSSDIQNINQGVIWFHCSNKMLSQISSHDIQLFKTSNIFKIGHLTVEND